MSPPLFKADKLVKKKIAWLLAAAAIAALALIVRLRAVEQLPIDYDEDDYLAAAQHYAAAIRHGDWQAVIDYRFNHEHPPLAKLAYALALLDLPETPLMQEPPDPNLPPARTLPQPHFQRARLFSAVLGVLEALALAAINPLAGLLLAINTWHIKYTAQIMLESLPSLTSLLAVLFYLLARPPGKMRQGVAWLAASAVMLGLTAAAKYMYALVGLAILTDWFLEQGASGRLERKAWRHWVIPALAWGGLALLVFFAFNPSLWNDSLPRLAQSLLFHRSYAQGEHVQRVGYPFWQPLVWLSIPVPWHPGVFLFPFDLLVTLLALFGLGRLWRRRRVFALWLAGGLLFLFLWPTKWPQYILLISAPLCLAAWYGLQAVFLEPLAAALRCRFDQDDPRKLARQPITWRQNLAVLPWLLPGAGLLILITFFPLVYQLAMSLTDLSVMSLRDALQGGLWRAIWQGLSGQVEPVVFDVFQPQRASQVRYAGPTLLGEVFLSGIDGLVAFEVLWTVLSVALQLGLGLFVALLLEKKEVHFKAGWRLAFLLPWAIPEFAGALMWLQIYDPQFGWARQTAERLGANAPAMLTALARWPEDPNVTLFLLLVAATWYGFPLMMLATTAGLKMIPAAVYEAAAIDGASGWNLFRLVTWPLLLPLLAPVIILRAIFAFNQFYLFYVIRPPQYLTLSLLSFQLVGNGNYAISAALNIFVVVVLIILILIFNRWSQALEGVRYA